MGSNNTVYKKLLGIQEAVAALTKDGAGDKYTYVTGNKILNHIRPLMVKAGLLLLTDVESADFSRQDYNTQKGTKSEMFCSLALKFTWVDTESGDTVEVKWASSGMNGFDKGLGSALTYGERYFLLKQFHIATDRDDVDAKVREEAESEELKVAIEYISGAMDAGELNYYHNYYKDSFGDNPLFVKAVVETQKRLGNG